METFYCSDLVDYDRGLNEFYGLGDKQEWHHISRDLLLDLRNGVSVFSNTKSNISIQKVYIQWYYQSLKYTKYFYTLYF